MPPGRYMLGGAPIELPAGDGTPPVRAGGTLAGSALRMDVAVANMVHAGAGLPQAVAAAAAPGSRQTWSEGRTWAGSSRVRRPT